MRKNKAGQQKNGFTMLVLDDDKNITDALYSYFESSGYTVDTENDPLAALEMMKNKSYDILLLDFIMYPICGDEVVARLRAFDTRIFVIMLTGHREVAPPLNTVRELDIQGILRRVTALTNWSFWWKAVSNTPTCGILGRIAETAFTPFKLAGL